MIKILGITENPLSTMGELAGICYGQDNPKRFAGIAKRCLAEGHGRVSEFVEVTLVLDGYSAKVIRELYTHIIGTSRLQSSTRYIDYSNQFDYVLPSSVAKNTEALEIWQETMKTISKAMINLKDLGIPTEDFTNLLPLAYETKMVLKINLRALIHMFHVRACTCAYWEFRNLMQDIKNQLEKYGPEWEFIAKEYFVPKCVASGYCDETTRHCGRMPVKEKK